MKGFTKLQIFIFLLASFLMLFSGCMGNGHPRTDLTENSGLPIMSRIELNKHNGDSPEYPIYIGLDGYVYDVSTGDKFYGKTGRYHFLAGKDSTKKLRFFGGRIIKRKYPAIAVLEPLTP